MSGSELITPHHLSRAAIIYIRQSTQQQVLSNQESLRLQYALRERALELGWRAPDVVIIDTDLGLTAASAAHREGFKDLVARVTLDLVGIILSVDVTRLSRNCSDWYPLLDLCGYTRCLIADRDGVYDPSTANGRLLLGLKGTLSEMELFTIRSRLRTGLMSKAGRGELAIRLPVGFVRDEAGGVSKDPNLEIQSRIELIFSTFLRVGSASQVARVLNEQALSIPRRRGYDEVAWRTADPGSITMTLKNPAYAGTFAYGRTRAVAGPSPTSVPSKRQLAIEQWSVQVKDKYPAYISWETYERIQRMLADNYAEYEARKSRGLPRTGVALLHGIVWCGACGHKMVMRYKPTPVYVCNRLRMQYRAPVCQTLPTAPVDARVSAAFLEALSPVEIDAYARAVASQREADATLVRARSQQLERLRYLASLAERQFNRVDPDNRLVAGELERRWEAALREVKRAEQEEAAFEAEARVVPLSVSAELKAAFSSIGERMPSAWESGLLSPASKKALLRCLIEKVVLHRSPRDTIQTRIVWRGGDTSALSVSVPVGAVSELANAAEMEARILELSREGWSDDRIAERMMSEGFRSPRSESVLPSTVQAIRLRHRVLVNGASSHPLNIPGSLTVTQAAEIIGVPSSWIYSRIRRGAVSVERDPDTGHYLFPDTEETRVRLRQLKDEPASADRAPARLLKEH